MDIQVSLCQKLATREIRENCQILFSTSFSSFKDFSCKQAVLWMFNNFLEFKVFFYLKMKKLSLLFTVFDLIPKRIPSSYSLEARLRFVSRPHQRFHFQRG